MLQYYYSDFIFNYISMFSSILSYLNLFVNISKFKSKLHAYYITYSFFNSLYISSIRNLLL